MICGNCHRPFSIPSPAFPGADGAPPNLHNRVISCLSAGSASNSSLLIAARCPQCRKVTSVGQGYARVRWTSYLIVTLLLLFIAICVTWGTVAAAFNQKGLYFLWSGEFMVFFYLAGICTWLLKLSTWSRHCKLLIVRCLIHEAFLLCYLSLLFIILGNLMLDLYIYFCFVDQKMQLL